MPFLLRKLQKFNELTVRVTESDLRNYWNLVFTVQATWLV